MKNILIQPIISEKSMNLVAEGKYTFEVGRSANKIEIANEIERVYKVKATKVNIVNKKGLDKLFNMKTKGRTRAWQKAIITLKKGQKISDFDVKK